MKQRPKLLLVEDDDEVRVALTRALEGAGYAVRALADGRHFADVAASALLLDSSDSSPDVIVTDVRLPGFNGLGVVEGLRLAGWDVPVVVISAFGDAEMRARVAVLGHAVLLAKPLNFQRLRGAIDSALAKPGSGLM
jgi:DNA-binding response OmpR family regulator